MAVRLLTIDLALAKNVRAGAIVLVSIATATIVAVAVAVAVRHVTVHLALIADI